MEGLWVGCCFSFWGLGFGEFRAEGLGLGLGDSWFRIALPISRIPHPACLNLGPGVMWHCHEYNMAFLNKGR